jgi:hypothetical protein
LWGGEVGSWRFEVESREFRVYRGLKFKEAESGVYGVYRVYERLSQIRPSFW